MNNLLSSVDLRSNIDTVYSQSTSDSCLPHSTINAAEVLCDRAGKSMRFSRAALYSHGLVVANKPQGSGGLDGAHMMTALKQYGLLLESDWPWSRLYQIPPDTIKSPLRDINMLPMQGNIQDIKRKLCLGIPVIMGMVCHQGFFEMGGNNWRLHNWSTAIMTTYAHAVCIVGYDDAAERFLVENSWGPNWGDGGFFGLPYNLLRQVAMGFWTIDNIYKVPNVPVENYVTIPYLLDPIDNSTFTSKNKPRLRSELESAFISGGWPAVLNYCRTEYVTDKHMEHIFGWPRRTVRNFYESPDGAGLNWVDFPWAPQ